MSLGLFFELAALVRDASISNQAERPADIHGENDRYRDRPQRAREQYLNTLGFGSEVADKAAGGGGYVLRETKASSFPLKADKVTPDRPALRGRLFRRGRAAAGGGEADRGGAAAPLDGVTAAHALSAERHTLVLLLALGLANIALGVWRPRMPQWPV